MQFNYTLDLRFQVPPFLALLFHLLLSSNKITLWDSIQYPLMRKLTLPIAPLFLIVSVKLPLSLSVSPRCIHMQFGDSFYLSASASFYCLGGLSFIVTSTILLRVPDFFVHNSGSLFSLGFCHSQAMVGVH